MAEPDNQGIKALTGTLIIKLKLKIGNKHKSSLQCNNLKNQCSL